MNDKVSINKLLQTDNLSFEKFVEEDQKIMLHVPAVGFTEEMEIDKTLRRKKRNRKSADNHRKRKKRYIAGLETIVMEMKCKMNRLLDENEILKEQIDNYELKKVLPDLSNDDFVLFLD